MRVRALMCVLLVLMAIHGWAFTRDEVLLYVPFDGTVQPLVATGPGQAKITGEFGYAEGPVGSAVLVGEKDTIISYPAEGNILPEQGTFAIWVRSLDWTLEEMVNRWWVDFPGPTRFIIYHYLHSPTIFFYHMDEARKHPSIIKAQEQWVPGEWKHLAGTWKKGRLRLFVNGQPVPEEAEVQLGALGDWIQLGAPSKGTADTMLDEFYVFSRALEDVEVRSLYLRGTAGADASVAIPRIATPQVDGIISQGEYGRAAAVTGFGNRATGLLDEEQGTAWLGSDGSALHVAFSWPIPERVLRAPDQYNNGPISRQLAERDAPLTTDDCAGIEIRVGEGPVHRVLVNGLSALRDERDGDPSWNAPVSARSVLGERTWDTEIAIPLDAIGAIGDAPVHIRLLRLHRLLRSDDVSWPSPDADVFARATLREDSSAVQFTAIGQPWDGSMDVQVRATGEVPVTASVTTDSEEVIREAQLDAGNPDLRVKATLTDTSLTHVSVQATLGEERLLALSLPVTYPPSLNAACYLFPSRDLLEVVLSTRGGASKRGGTVTVGSESGEETKVRAEIPSDVGDRRTVPLDVSSLTPARYTATVRLGSEQEPAGTVTLPFEIRPKPEWMGNEVGIVDEVPKPWTPLEYADETVRCWGRSVDLGGSMLPGQITSQGEPLLTRPVRLVAKLDGTELETSAAALTWTEQAGNVARWETTGRIGGCSARVKAYMEFDGMMWFEVTVQGTADQTMESLRLEVPIAAEHSTLFYSGNYRTIDTGRRPAETWQSAFRPCLGLSDEERGLQWFAQSARGWLPADNEAALRVIPGENETVLEARIIDVATTLGQPIQFAFGLHPSPARPAAPGWRNLRPMGDPELAPKPNLALWTTHYCLGCSYPLPFTDTGKRMLGNRRATGLESHAYTRLCECSVKGPWYEYFRDEWRIDPGPRADYDPDAEWGTANPVCPKSASWRDWTAWSFREFFEQSGFEGLYYDVSRAPLCRNEHHGCGYRDANGVWRPEYQILASRELLKRLYVMLHGDFEDKLISYHMSGDLWLPMVSFCDLTVDGENLHSFIVETANYYELMPLAKFRAEFMGHQWGPTAVLLPQFTRANQREKERLEQDPNAREVRHLAGMIFLHDALPWPAYSNLAAYHAIWAAQDELGWGDGVEFLPYWDNARYVEPMQEDLVASVFRKGDRALIVLFNNTDGDETAELRLNPGALGITAIELRDFESGEKHALAEGVARVPVQARDFRLLFVGG